MSKLTVEDTSLVSVANAIRTKGGTTGALTFPNGFVSAIEGIKTGSSLGPLVDGSITEVTADMLEGCTKLKQYIFRYCNSLTSVEIPGTVSSIEGNAFYGCAALENVEIREGVSSISSSAFENCTKLKSISLPNSLSSIGTYAFRKCQILESIDIPDNVSILRNSTFEGCTKLASVVFPENLESIEDEVFSHCGLTNIALPSGITSIGYSAFRFCSNLASVEIKATSPPTIQSNSFDYTSLTTIKVPSASLSAYKSATNWSKYAKIMVGV